MLALTCSSGALSIAQLSKVNAATDDLATNWLPSARTLGVYAIATYDIRRSQSRLAMTSDPAEIAQQLKAIATRDRWLRRPGAATRRW